jgi:hypothetical protein
VTGILSATPTALPADEPRATVVATTRTMMPTISELAAGPRRWLLGHNACHAALPVSSVGGRIAAATATAAARRPAFEMTGWKRIRSSGEVHGRSRFGQRASKVLLPERHRRG